MPAIGNDIVDLTTPENRNKSRDRRFLDRVFTPEERAFIGPAEQPEAILWALWAGKEGAYKAISKINPGVSSVPRRYHVRFLKGDPKTCLVSSQEAILSGLVETPAGEVFFRTLLTPQYVHCLAVTGTCLSEKLIFQVLDLQDQPDLSASLQRTVVRRLSSLLGIHPSTIEIQRPRTPLGYGPPRIFVEGEETELDISLSHDGRYGAYALHC